MEPGMHDWFGRITKGPFPGPKDGHFPLPPGPGVGVDIDEPALAALPSGPETHPSSYLRHARLASRQGVDWA